MVLWPKMHFIPKKHPKFLQRVIFILEKGTFFFEQLFPVVARTWLEYRSVCFFLGPKSRFFAEKSYFCQMTPILVIGLFVALGETVHFPPWERFFYILFPRYGRFCKQKNWSTRQKVFPLPTVRAPSASNSPSALSAQALQAHALRTRAG